MALLEQYSASVAERAPSVQQALEGVSCTIKGQVMCLLAGSALHAKILEDIRPQLLSYLSEHLKKDWQLQIKTKVLSIQPRKIYTEVEKYHHLVEKYPLIKTLKERIKLDITPYDGAQSA